MPEKHPPCCAALTDLSAHDPQQCISVEESEVCQAVFFSFSTGLVGGPDGLRPKHIHDLLMSREVGPDFVLYQQSLSSLGQPKLYHQDIPGSN